MVYARRGPGWTSATSRRRGPSWQGAREVADRLPVDDPGRLSMRIAPRTCCAAPPGWLVVMAETAFDDYATSHGAAGDKMSLAVGMDGPPQPRL